MRRASRHSPAHAELALLLKDLRLEVGLSRAEVSERLGDRQQSYVPSVEVGQQGIDLIQVMELASLYGVSLVEFSGRFQERLDIREAERRPPRRRRTR